MLFTGPEGNKNHMWMELDGRNISWCVFPVLKEKAIPDYLERGVNRYGRRIFLRLSLWLWAEMIRLHHS